MKKIILLSIFILLLSSTQALGLQIFPHHEKSMKKNGMSHNMHSKKKKQFVIMDYNGTQEVNVTYILPSLETHNLVPKGNIVSLPKTKGDNYHAIVASVEDADNIYNASYYIYKYGMPSRQSPTKITSMDKLSLEIKPNPLPKEHNEYKTSNKYGFILTFKSKPISSKVKLTTLNGTTQEVQSDKNGNFTLILPNDFKEVKNSKMGNRPSHFMLSAKVKDADKVYHTTFTMPYHVNPNDYWQNTPYGFLVALIGLALGLFLYRRSKNG